jgi:hypothetical protein
MQVYFCNGMRLNTIVDILSQKDSNQNGIPEPFFLGIGTTNTQSNIVTMHSGTFF